MSDSDTPAIQLADIDHIVLRVTDVDSMVAFYTQVLGCRLAKRNEKMGLLHLTAGRSLIDLITVDGPLGKKGGAAPSKSGRNLDHFCLRVDAFDPVAIIEHLTTHHVRVDPPQDRFGANGYGLSIYLNDPEGNVIELRASDA